MRIRGKAPGAAALLLATASAGAVAAQPGASDFEHPGLELALRSQESGATDVRVARLAAIYVPAGQALSPFIDAGPFKATFRGAIELDLNDWYRFSVRGSGAVRLSIGGEVVLESENLPTGGDPVSTDGEVRLVKGLNPFELVYRSPADDDASLRLNWSNDYVPEEPLPPESLRHADSPALDRGQARRAARSLIADAMCVRCHPTVGTSSPAADAMPELDAMAPDLDAVGTRRRPRWIERWLLDPKSLRSQARMPRLLSPAAGEARQQAADIAAYLTASNVEVALRSAAAPPASTVAEGKRLYAEIGCAACHGDGTSSPFMATAPPLVDAPPAANGSGTQVTAVSLRDKWQLSSLARYLLDPARFDPSSRMPHLALEPAEARALAAYLLARVNEGGSAPTDTTSTGTPVPAPLQGDPERGRRLADELGCRGCHALAGGEPPAPTQPMSRLAGGALRGLTAENTESKHPRYDFDAAEIALIERFLTEDSDSLARRVPAEFAERRIRSGGCLACHARDGAAASWSPPAPTLVQSTNADAAQDDFAFSPEAADEPGPDLLPPDLTWAGEKLRSEWLEDFLAGRTADRPRPHLRVRMPTFPSHADILSAGLHHQHGLPASPPNAEPPDQALAAIGGDLIRGDRLGCHSCHALGDEPALGGEGSEETINFALVRRRLRRDYFDRFLRDPQRILPGSKMPQFVDEDGYTALYDVFDGEAQRQFNAIWHYLATLD